MTDSNVPACKKCNEGNLVPFYSPDGRNVYFCTNCGIRFTGYINEPTINDEPIFLKMAIYDTSQEDVEPKETSEEVEEPEAEPEITE